MIWDVETHKNVYEMESGICHKQPVIENRDVNGSEKVMERLIGEKQNGFFPLLNINTGNTASDVYRRNNITGGWEMEKGIQWRLW